MKLEKAIEVLTAENKRPWNHSGSDLREAVKLGIEALKRCQLKEPYASFNLGRPLPGETTKK